MAPLLIIGNILFAIQVVLSEESEALQSSAAPSLKFKWWTISLLLSSHFSYMLSFSFSSWKEHSTISYVHSFSPIYSVVCCTFCVNNQFTENFDLLHTHQSQNLELFKCRPDVDSYPCILAKIYIT